MRSYHLQICRSVGSWMLACLLVASVESQQQQQQQQQQPRVTDLNPLPQRRQYASPSLASRSTNKYIDYTQPQLAAPIAVVASGNPPAASNDVTQHQRVNGAPRKCTRQSIMLARQMLVHELNHLNSFNALWFNDLDKDELIEGQKHSLSNIVMSGHGTRLLHSDGQPLIEIESSYFRAPSQQAANENSNQNYNSASISKQPLTIKLIRRHQDKCQLSADKSQFIYSLGLSLGPLEHHMDVLYNLPKDLSLSQPIEWHYGQIVIQVPKMIYEVTLRQMSHYKLNALTPFTSNCPLDVSEVLYLPPSSHTNGMADNSATVGHQSSGKTQMGITSTGLALNNQTILQVERLFDDYTRPTVSRRLRQMLKFYLNTKTLPLTSSACADCH